jgi:hypothetical protein
MKKKTGAQNHPNRRKFIKEASLAATSFMIVPRHVLGGQDFVAPSDKLNIAGIGVGGKGTSDLSSFAKSPNAILSLYAMSTTVRQ